MSPNFFIQLSLLTFFLVSTNAQEKYPNKIGQTSDRALPEISGVITSQKHDNIFWVVNDGGNDAKRKSCQLYIIEEPKLKEKKVSIKHTLEFTYEDGPRDCESIAFDPVEQTILLISKRTTPPSLYQLPLPDLNENNQNIQTAKKITEIKNIPNPTKYDLKNKYGKYRSQPTSMDVNKDGNKLILLTYKNAYLYKKSNNENWKQAFLNKPTIIQLIHPKYKQMLQREAITFTKNQQHIICISEKLPVHIFKYPLPN